jgi:hypothetical protein
MEKAPALYILRPLTRQTMITVREVFRIEPEKMRECKELVKEMMKVEAEATGRTSRAMTDLSGEYFTLVIESDHADLADFERHMREGFSDERFRTMYSKFRPMLRGGHREIYQGLE